MDLDTPPPNFAEFTTRKPDKMETPDYELGMTTSAEYVDSSTWDQLLTMTWQLAAYKEKSVTIANWVDRDFQDHTFEGVDYARFDYNENKHVYLNNNDCDAYHNQCIRDEPYHAPVCAYDIEWNYWYEFFSVCQIELENCWAKHLSGVHMKKQSRNRERYYFAGEARDCMTFARMGNIEDAYFDSSRNTRRSASELNYMRDFVKKQIKLKGRPKILKHYSMRAISDVLNAYKTACPL